MSEMNLMFVGIINYMHDELVYLKFDKGEKIMNKAIKMNIIFCAILIVALIYPVETRASFIQEEQARNVVENWRMMNSSPMNSTMGHVIEEIRYYQGEPYGNPGYYVAFLNPNGWVIVPADDSFEPILAFGAGKLTPELFETSPIRYLFRVGVPDV
jgi:hypothetical protein